MLPQRLIRHNDVYFKKTHKFRCSKLIRQVIDPRIPQSPLTATALLDPTEKRILSFSYNYGNSHWTSSREPKIICLFNRASEFRNKMKFSVSACNCQLFPLKTFPVCATMYISCSFTLSKSITAKRKVRLF